MTRISAWFGRERLAGLLMASIGGAAIVQAWDYGIGTLSEMGSGFFPSVVGAGLVAMGVLLGAARGALSPEEGGHAVQPPNWRGAVAIMAGVLLFIVLAGWAGLAPATFACVFVAALGTGSTRPVEAMALAAGVTVFGVLLFRYGLHVPFATVRGLLP